MPIQMRTANQLDWIRCQGGGWCDMLNVDLDHDHFNNIEGVYIIWHGGQNPASVRVGQGVIKDRLAAHRQDREILAYASLGLYATWAQVSSVIRDGVERFLAEALNPKVGSRYPVVLPIPVNLPW